MAINWFPGHMAKAIRELKEYVKTVDVIIEIRDARIITSSANPEIDTISENKAKIILLNKWDLSESTVTKNWVTFLSNSNVIALPVNSITGEGLKLIKPAIDTLLQEKIQRQKNKGLVKIVTRAMILGIPNVGKSSFINKISQSSIAKTGNKPGVTKNRQWIKTKLGLELLDTPGILYPKLHDQNIAVNLALTGAIKDEIMDIQELAIKLLEKLSVFYAKNIMQRYNMESLPSEHTSILEEIAKKRGCLMLGGNVDFERVSRLLIDEFRAGKLGRISLERPEQI
ncbi:MAG TPA: ribosome biogenesis GTPase YlqF [Clostridiaceae bacterium]